MLILVAVILPGIVFSTVLQRLRGPTPEDKDTGTRVLRATAVGVALDVFYVLVGGSSVTRLLANVTSTGHTSGLLSDPRRTGFWALILIGVVPATLALLVHAQAAYRDAPPNLSRWQRLRRIGHTTYRTTPTAWDYIARKRGDCFVRVRLSDGEYVGGWADSDTYVSGYPENRDLFIANQWALDPQGRFLHEIEGTLGFYVTVADGVLVEWIEAPPQSPSTPNQSTS